MHQESCVILCFLSPSSSMLIQSLNPVFPMKYPSTFGIIAFHTRWDFTVKHLTTLSATFKPQTAQSPAISGYKLWPNQSSCRYHRIMLIGSIPYYFCSHTAQFSLTSFLSFAFSFPFLPTVFSTFITFLDFLPCPPPSRVQLQASTSVNNRILQV